MVVVTVVVVDGSSEEEKIRQKILKEELTVSDFPISQIFIFFLTFLKPL